MEKFASGVALLTLAACASTTAPKAFVRAPSMQPVLESPATLSADPVVVAQEVIEGFQFLYRFVHETEFVLCLEGTRTNGSINITGFRLARMTMTTLNSVKYEPCSSRQYVGTAHNHPPVNGTWSLCYQSQPDLFSFQSDARAVVDIVLCGRTTFMWVLKDGRKSIIGNDR